MQPPASGNRKAWTETEGNPMNGMHEIYNIGIFSEVIHG
jgi:hypothetical protein